MRRSLILLLVLVVLSAGVIGAGAMYVDKDAESVSYTEQRLYGDPAAGEGLQIESLLTYEGRLHWANTVTLGPEIGVDCDFHFTPNYTTERELSPETMPLYCQSNLGMSSNGPLDFTEDWDTAWLADALTAAAEQTPAGAEDYPVTLPLADYATYYEMMLDGPMGMWYDSELPQFWDTVTEFFHVPVGQDDMVEITISKDEAGNVYGVSYNLPGVEYIYGSGILGPDGCWYLLFTARDADGNPIEGAAPQGIYRIPIREVFYAQATFEQVVESQVELVYEAELDGTLYAMEDNTRMLLLAGNEAVLFDWATMEPIQTFPVGGHYTGNENGWYNTQVENDHVVTLSHYREGEEEPIAGQWTTVWALGDDGLYHKVIDCDTTAGLEENSVYFSSFFDGERFLRVSYMDYYWDGSLHVQLCDSQGLQYAAQLVVNLRESRFNNCMIQTETSRPTPGLVP